MKSRIFCFNRTILKKNVTRFWPLWGLYLAFLMFSMPISLFWLIRSGDYTKTYTAGERLGVVLKLLNMNLSPVIVFGVSVFFALAVFSYLYNARSCNMFHAFPVSRKELFVTNYMSGMLFLILPQVIAFLLSLLVCIIGNVTSVEYLLYWLAFSLGMDFFFYSLAVFCCMLTGQHFAAVAFYALANVIYLGLRILLHTVVAVLSYGFSYYDIRVTSWNVDTILSPLLFLSSRVEINPVYDDAGTELLSVTVGGGNVILFYCIPAVALVLLSWLFYRRRQLESAGDVVSYNWMKPIFRWLIGFCGGIGLSLILTVIFFLNSRYETLFLILMSVIFSCICFLLSEMILQKGFRIFKRRVWLEWMGCAAAVLFVLIGVQTDLFGLERRIPETDEVAAVLIENAYDISTDDPAQIEEIEEIHRRIVDHKKEYQKAFYDGAGYSSVQIAYYLKNGETIRRSYNVPLSDELLMEQDSAIAVIETLQSDPETLLEYLFTKNYKELSYTGGTLNRVTANGEEIVAELTAEEAQTLFEAYQKDVLAGNFTLSIMDDLTDEDNVATFYNNLTLESTRRRSKIQTIYDCIPGGGTEEFVNSSSPTSIWGKDDQRDPLCTINSYLELTPSCENTIQTLLELGVLKDESELITWDQYYEINDVDYE